jgi:succinoglycan biosynthesis protein ExoO
MSVDVSVVIAAYNAAEFVERAVLSALAQRGVTLEVIVVDDGSCDDTVEIVRGIDDLRLGVIVMPKNGGAAAARNAGFKAAVGEWIAVLDSDDVLAEGRLARCVGTARARGADMVVDNMLVDRGGDDEDMEVMFEPARFEALEQMDLAVFAGERLSRGARWTLGYLKPVFSTAFLREHALSYDEDLAVGEDYMLVADALAHGAVCAVEPSEGYVYSVREGSLSHRVSSDVVASILRAEGEFLARHDVSPQVAALVGAKMARLRKDYAYALLVEGIKGLDFGGVIGGLKLNPLCVFGLLEPIWVRVRGGRG